MPYGLVMTDNQTSQGTSLDDAAIVLHAIENSRLVEWEPAEFGSIAKRDRFLANVLAAVAPSGLSYVNGRVGISSEPFDMKAHAFAGDWVVRIDGVATDPTVTIYPNKPQSIRMVDAPADFRSNGRLTFEVTYEWGAVEVSERHGDAFGDERSLLQDLRARLA